MRIFIFITVFAVMVQYSFIGYAHAAERLINKSKSLFLTNIYHEGITKYDVQKNPLDPPPEPYFEQIKFLKQAPADSLTQRIDRLIHGTKIDIPPEYDHYGHEIRRYMSDLLTPADLNDPEKLAQKIANVKKARIILEYWRKSISEEQKAIEEIIQNKNVSPSTITSFRFNSGSVDQFISDAYMWVDRNLEFLEFLQENQGEYYVQYPYYQVDDSVVRANFEKKFNNRRKGLERIIQYSPFRSMIY